MRFWLSPGRRRPVELHQLKPAVAVPGPHHCDLDLDAVEPHDAVRPTSLDFRIALELKTKFDKESDSSCEIVDNNADVVHPPNRHVGHHGTGSSRLSSSTSLECLGRISSTIK